MKRILLLVTLAAFLITGSLIYAKDFMVNCCVKGQCSKMTAPACERVKGRVVQDCGQCR
jgi:hypothetical protein